MVKNNITARVTAEQEKFLNETFPELKQIEIFNILLKNYQNPPQQDNSELIAKIAELEEKCKEFEGINNSNIVNCHNVMEEAKGKINDLTSENQQLTAENADLKQQLFTANGLAPKENALVIELKKPTDILLSETAKRLAEKYGKEVSQQDILLDMFNKYTVEHLTEWFYPFLFSKKELETLTGYPYSVLRKWVYGEKNEVNNE